jgi:hypothetical protein
VITPGATVTWLQAASWLVGLLGVGFLVSWLATDVGHTPRRRYILVLAMVTVALTGGYLAWAGIGIGEWVTYNAGWGLLGGAIVAVPVARGITRLPATRSRLQWRGTPRTRRVGPRPGPGWSRRGSWRCWPLSR